MTLISELRSTTLMTLIALISELHSTTLMTLIALISELRSTTLMTLIALISELHSTTRARWGSGSVSRVDASQVHVPPGALERAARLAQWLV